MDYVQSVHKMFWNEYFWLPPNRTWAELENHPGSSQRHPEAKDLAVIIPIALLLIVIRQALRTTVTQPLGIWFGLRKSKYIRPENCQQLHAFFRKERRPTHRQVQSLSLELSWSTRRIERWFRLKRNQQKATVLKKFCEGGWRFVFYTCIHIFGLHVLHDEDFIWRVKDTVNVEAWPSGSITWEFYWYYMIELGFYTSLLISLIWDVHRRDFYVQFVHHVLTMGLMVLSWTSNFFQVGMLILFVHDVADCWLEICKCLKYIKYDKLASTLFVVFTTIWLVSRMYILPVHITLVCWTETWGKLWPTAVIILSSLLLLQVLHTIWTMTILRAFYSVLVYGEGEDDRSDSEESEVSSSEAVDDWDQENHNRLGKTIKLAKHEQNGKPVPKPEQNGTLSQKSKPNRRVRKQE